MDVVGRDMCGIFVVHIYDAIRKGIFLDDQLKILQALESPYLFQYIITSEVVPYYAAALCSKHDPAHHSHLQVLG